MNERIKELAKQAVVVKMRKQHVNGGLPPRAYESLEFSKEKFDELIVKACAAFIDSHEQLDKYGEPYEMVYGKDVLKHFGIKE